uniref:Uncharacterized protein n=1 Tax=Oryza punctata TaxID=4537 RepID=A0A0E0KKM5_ORYPU
MAKHLRRRGLAVVVAPGRRRALDTLRLANPVLREFLRSLPDAVDALLLDAFCVDELDVAAYFFFPSGASALAALLHLPYYYPDLPSFREMGMELVRLPGMPPFRAVDMLATVQDKESDATKVRPYQFKHTPRVYCIGPLVDAAGKNGERHPCLAWLDAQPRQSVVFLCFGSQGAFPYMTDMNTTRCLIPEHITYISN